MTPLGPKCLLCVPQKHMCPAPIGLNNSLGLNNGNTKLVNMIACFYARSQSKKTSRFSCPTLALPAAYDQPELYNFVHITKDMSQAQGVFLRLLIICTP